MLSSLFESLRLRSIGARVQRSSDTCSPDGDKPDSDKPGNRGPNFLSSGVAVLVLRGVGAGVALLLQIMIARLLGASDAGIYFLALSILMLSSTFGRLGIDKAVTKFVAGARADGSDQMAMAAVRKAVICVALFCGITGIALFVSAELISSWFDEESLIASIRLAAVFSVPLGLAWLYSQALMGLGRAVDTSLTQNVITPGVAALALVPLVHWYGGTGAMMAFGIGSCVTCLYGMYRWYQFSESPRQLRFSVSELTEVSIPLWIMTLAAQLRLYLPIIALGIWADSSEAGIFAISQRVAMLVGLILFASNVVMTPRVARLWQDGETAKLEMLCRVTATLMVVVAMPAIMFLLIFPSTVLSLFGEDFERGWIALTILILGQLVNVVTISSEIVLSLTGHHRLLMMTGVQGAVCCLILCIVLVPEFQLLGAAIAAAISAGIVNAIRVYQFRRLAGINVLPLVAGPSRLRLSLKDALGRAG